MMMNQAAPTLAAPYASVETEHYSTGEMFEFARLFEEDGVDGLYAQDAPAPAADDMMSPRPIGPSFRSCSSSSSPSRSQQQQQQTSQQQLQQQNIVSPPPNQNSCSDFLFIVDPSTQQLIFPKQQQTLNSMLTNDKNTLSSLGLLNNLQNSNSAWNNQQQYQASINSMLSSLGMTFQQQQAPQQVGSQQQLAYNLSGFSFLGNGTENMVTPPQPEVSSSPPPQEPNLPPLRALSAYNFFFRDERDRILHDKEHDWTMNKQDALLREHWSRDRSKKRRHRKTHGKIDFTTLSKLISSRWKELSEDRKEFYRAVAARDWERYQLELTKFKSDAEITTSSGAVFQPVVG